MIKVHRLFRDKLDEITDMLTDDGTIVWVEVSAVCPIILVIKAVNRL